MAFYDPAELLFGAPSVTLRLAGDITGDTVTVEGEAVEDPEMKVTGVASWIADP